MYVTRYLQFEATSSSAKREGGHRCILLDLLRFWSVWGRVAYKLALLPKMSGVHNIFYVSILRKCAYNLKHEIDLKDIEGLVRVLDHEVKKLRNKETLLVKIQWKHHVEGEAAWELESKMREKFS